MRGNDKRTHKFIRDLNKASSFKGVSSGSARSFKRMKVDKTDWKYVNVDPDPDFDEDHNRQVIDNVIKQNERQRRILERERKEKLGERTSAMASYIKNTKDNTTPEQYFGKRYIAKLRGEEIVNKLKYASQQKEH